jgi:hypothetical protein
VEEYNLVPNSNSKLFPFGSSSKHPEQLQTEAPLGYIDETGVYRTNLNSHRKTGFPFLTREPPGAQETFLVNERPRVS